MTNLLDACRSRILVCDGAMGTQLQRAGLAPGESGDAWTIHHPERVEAIHRAYVEAGADIVTTNSFGANRWVLGRYGLAERAGEINRTSVTVARRASRPGVFVLGDIGPFGGLLHPYGEVTAAEVRGAFAEQAASLLDAGADGIIVETMSAIEEAVAAVEAAREAGASLVVASMAFEQKGRGPRTMMGVTPEGAARALAEAGADIVGANCGTGLAPEDVAGIARAMRAASSRPVLVQPNAGQPVLEDGQAVYIMGPDAFAEAMAPALAEGVAVAGGCCGTTPAHIAALARAVRAKENRS